MADITPAEILQKYWGYDSFRELQPQIIESILGGKDTLGLLPTGGGKSITFQVPALMMPGLTIVITPLISLMKDQVDNLRSHDIKAASIHSGLTRSEHRLAMDRCRLGKLKLLYVSPEKLQSASFIDELRTWNVSLIVVDEAHCISQWGYDFRPSYLKIAAIRKLFPQAPVLALTASATPDVADDIMTQLNFRQRNIFARSFTRKNISYIVRYTDNKNEMLLRIFRSTHGSGIVYVRSRRRTKEIADLLNSAGISADFYHAGLQTQEKNERQNNWKKGATRVMVATNAFGMGIDKPDVRLVLHVGLPDSLEEYFQEAGRAGRDGLPSRAVLLTDGTEASSISRRLQQHFPDLDYIRKVYEHVCCFFELAVGDGLNVTREFNIDRFCVAFSHFPTTLVSALEMLDMAGYLTFRSEDEACSRLLLLAMRNELFRALDPVGERIVLSLLRHYGGLFVDYGFIDEDLLCRDTGLSADVVYQTLVLLDRRRLVSYIPRKRLPRITFRCRRVDKEEIYLPPAVYEKRRLRYSERLSAMMRYIETNGSVCRSRMLLDYFGEQSSCDCGRCDVCTSGRVSSVADVGTLCRRILAQLGKGSVEATQLDVEGFDASVVESAIDALRADGRIVMEGSLLRAVEE